MKKSPLELELEDHSLEEEELAVSDHKSLLSTALIPNSDVLSSDIDDSSDLALHDRLGDRVIECVKEAPNFTIRPARLAQQLGISIDDASAELCGLLAAVGGGDSGAYFKFEPIAVDANNVPVDDDTSATTAAAVTMVFTFPPNFERRCKAYRVKEEVKETLLNIMVQLFRIVRALVSFGLILSIAIISVAVFLALIVAAVAMVTGGHGDSNRQGHHQHRAVALVSRFVRQLLRVVHQILMMYVLFGGNDDDRGYHDQAHSILRATYWFSSGMNPFWNPWFWASLRRSRMRRGWSTQRTATWNNHTHNSNPLRRYISTRAVISSNSSYNNSENFRGALFILMEFLFGPDDQWECSPTDNERWQMRAMAIIENGGKATLAELLPYVDKPPQSITDTAEAIWIISHFNGRPYRSTEMARDSKQHIFCFPELIMDSEGNNYTGTSSSSIYSKNQENNQTLTKLLNIKEFSWASFFFCSSREQSTSSIDMDSETLLVTTATGRQFPRFLVEEIRVLTKLSAEEFLACCLALLLNYLGSLWFRYAITNGSIIPKQYCPLLLSSFLKILATFLLFYSKVCCLLFLTRLAIMLTRNMLIWKRNQGRRKLADEVTKMKQNVGSSLAATASRDI